MFGSRDSSARQGELVRHWHSTLPEKWRASISREPDPSFLRAFVEAVAAITTGEGHALPSVVVAFTCCDGRHRNR